MLKNLSKKCQDLDPEVDDFQNLISSSLCKESKIHRWQSFHEDPIGCFYPKLLTTGPTNKQTNT